MAMRHGGPLYRLYQRRWPEFNALGDFNPGSDSMNLCGYSIPNGSYTLYVQAVGKPSITNQMSGAVKFTLKLLRRTSTTVQSLGAQPILDDDSFGRVGRSDCDCSRAIRGIQQCDRTVLLRLAKGE